MTHPTIHRLAMTAVVLAPFAAWSSKRLAAQTLCIDLGDAAGNFVSTGFCVPTDPGAIGGEVNIQLADLMFPAPDNPDGRLDIIVPLSHSITASPGQPISYATSLMWPDTPVSRESVRVRELGVNFKPDPTAPRVAPPLTDVQAGADPPDSFAWIEDPSDPTQVIGWSVQQELPGVPPEIGGSISHYHMTTWGLPATAPLAFSKSVTGGAVIPEPSTLTLGVLALFGVIGIAFGPFRARSLR